MADKQVSGLTSSTPTIDDLTISYDNADTSELKKTTWQLVRDLFKTYFDTVYQAVLVSGSNIKTVNGNSLLGSGDITISGGGSVATDTIWDAKGDLAVGTGSNTASRLAVGTNGQVLTADSAEATGTKWATVSGSGDMILASTQTVSGLKTFLNAMFALRNVANTFSGLFTNTNTADRTYTLQNRNGTLADDTDLALKANLASPTFTGTVVLPNSQALVTPVLGTPTSGTLTNCTGLPIAGLVASTSTAIGVGSVELGHASDTTITRVSAGVIAVEGETVPTISSTSTLTNKTLTTPAIASIKGTLTADTDGATITFDKNVSDFHGVTLGGNRTLALSNMAAGDRIILRLQQDGTGSRTVTWFSGISWQGGTAPTLTPTAGKADWFGFICKSAGAYDGFIIGQNI